MGLGPDPRNFPAANISRITVYSLGNVESPSENSDIFSDFVVNGPRLIHWGTNFAHSDNISCGGSIDTYFTLKHVYGLRKVESLDKNSDIFSDFVVNWPRLISHERYYTHLANISCGGPKYAHILYVDMFNNTVILINFKEIILKI